MVECRRPRSAFVQGPSQGQVGEPFNKVRRLWVGVPSSRRWVRILRRAFVDRAAGATGSGRPGGSSSPKSKGAQARSRLTQRVGEHAQEDVRPHPGPLTTLLTAQTSA